jgi:hypothetical protein
MTTKKSKKVHIDKKKQEQSTQKHPQKHSVRVAKKKKTSWEFPMNKKNLIYAAVGLGIIILGYALMATGITDKAALPVGTWNNPLAVSVAPILLIIGYCVIIPISIMKLFKKEKED